ncbi:hypothetical protein [Komagataeibacter xylinus]|uniref:hypothetical protein n=1 Tax=Komagataeibacter xylinus TaxID=28448 RepID=UPI001F5C426F|nr:hypothetical protein [Komagataeibacter xylinus]
MAGQLLALRHDFIAGDCAPGREIAGGSDLAIGWQQRDRAIRLEPDPAAGGGAVDARLAGLQVFRPAVLVIAGDGYAALAVATDEDDDMIGIR